MKCILGLDPGIVHTGYALLKENKEVITFSLLKNSQEIEDILDNFSPDYSFMEDVFLSRNPLMALRLGEVRGRLLYVLERRKIPVQHISAAKLKKSITGNGRANKRQVRYMVSQILGIKKVNNEHAIDALAIALCGLFMLERNNVLPDSGKSP